MYNNFLSKKSKKAISALLASALVITAAPINAEAATTKTLGVGKSFTVTAASAKSKITGLSAAEKKIVSVTRKNSKSKVYTIKAKTAGKVTFKIGAKTVKVNAGATKIFRNGSSKVTVTAGKYTNLDVRTAYGKGDTLTFTSSNSKVASIVKGKTTAKVKYNKSNSITKNTKALKAVKAGKATITIKSKNTGKSYKLYVTVKAATPKATATPVVTTNAPATPVVTETAPATTTAAAVTETPVATATAPAVTASAPAVTSTPVPTTGATITSTPVATATAPALTETPAPVQTATAPAVTQTPAPTETPSVVSASVVSVSAVNTQGETLATTAVTKNGTLKVTFSEVVTENSVNNNTFKVTDANGKNISLPVSAVTLTPGGKTVNVDLKDLGLDKGANYTLTVSGVKTKKGDEVVAKTAAFTVSKITVISKITLDDAGEDVILDSNMKNCDKNHPHGSLNEKGEPNGEFNNNDYILIKFDEYLDASTVTASNVKLTNETTGQQIAVALGTSSLGYVSIQTKTSLISNNLYTLSISGVKSALGGDVENLKHTFTVNGEKPLTKEYKARTLDAIELGVPNAKALWPKVEAGLKDTSVTTTQYYAGLKILVTVSELLDTDSVVNNVVLVEKETKEIVETSVSYDNVSRMITIAPKADLKENTDYQISFLGGLKTADNVYLDSDKKSDIVTDKDIDFSTIDATAPKVVSLVSKTGTTAFETAKAHEFVVTFSEGVSFEEKNVILAESSVDIESTGYGVLGTDKYSVTPVAGTDRKQYVIKINEKALETNKSYKIRVVGKDIVNYQAVSEAMVVNDASNNGQPNYLAKTETYTFSTTVDKTPASLLSVYKDDEINADKLLTDTRTNVKAGDTFTFLFDEKIDVDPAGITLQYLNSGSWEDVNGGIGNVGYAQNKDKENVAVTVKVASLKMVNAKALDGRYRFVFAKGAIKDQAETPNETSLFRYEFIGTDGEDTAEHVNAYYAVNKNASDKTLIDQTNKDGVNVKSRIFVVFDENELAGVSEANIVVKDTKGNAVAGTVSEVTDSDNSLVTTTNKVYSFVPASDLAYGTTYIVTVDGVKDVAGNSIEKKEVSFKTAVENLKVSSCSIEDKATNVDLTPVIKIGFNQEVTKDTDFSITLKDKAGADLIAANTAKVTGEKKEYSIVFKNLDASNATNKLNANETYVLEITDLKESDPDKKTLKKVTFTTGYTQTDSLKPSLTDDGATIGGYKLSSDVVTPVFDTASGISKIVLNFDEKIKKDDVVATITNMTDSSKAVDVISKSVDDGVLTLNTVGMGIGTNAAPISYKIVVSGVKDEAGNEADKLTYYVSVAADDGAAKLPAFKSGLTFEKSQDGDDGTKEVVTVDFTGGYSGSNDLTIAGVTISAASFADADTPEEVADIVSKETYSGWTAKLVTGAALTLTAVEFENSTASDTPTTISGTNFINVGNTGITLKDNVPKITTDGAAPKAEKYTLTCPAASGAKGDVTITFGDKSFKYTLSAGNEADTAIASAIQTGFTSDGKPTGYTATVSNEVITFTADTTGDKDTPNYSID